MRTHHPRVHVASLLLQKTARITLPFYRKIANDPLYGQRWSAAVRNADLDQMNRLIKQTIPRFDRHQFALGVNGIGYFIDAPTPGQLGIFTNSTAIPPGKVQFHFSAKAHRLIANAIQPLYEGISSNALFSKTIVEAIFRKETRILNQVIRSKVDSPNLQMVAIMPYGFRLRFKFPFDKYPYDNAFFLAFP
ncbi:hypothetical protein BEP19_03030 [Ammoniphilus oxalaticus]|uniref:Uncharacterized protein n=1 Tax=Ammoniphilus oxalaticus TaxID=66863 RepID=A0A419SNQ2_9BACL|nr:hypothetical protein [Ammoniphilus oxalaticus]RKD25918.1 hypothetical protein BEP19_03030 [Ammoniphilus oxalaticus]